MREFHPPMSMAPGLPRIEPPQFPDVNAQEDNFPMIPDTQSQDPMDQAVDGFQGDLGQDFGQYPVNDGFQAPPAQEGEMPADSIMQVDLPTKPVEMPDLIVEQAPLSAGKYTCIELLMKLFRHDSERNIVKEVITELCAFCYQCRRSFLYVSNKILNGT